ncbi:MAG: glycogen debranching protein GlgX [Actinomycetes bacterium]
MTTPATERAARASSSLGARVRGDGTEFALWAPRATRVELVLVDPDGGQANLDAEPSSDGVWTRFVPHVGAGQRYGYRVHGPWEPDGGARFNPAKLLLDPYARAITGELDFAGPIHDHPPGSNFVPDPTDDFGSVPLAVVVADAPPPPPLTAPVPLPDTVLYELHVKGYTRLHPDVPEAVRGTYAGLASPAVLDHLTGLGVTSVELLPIHHFCSEPFLVARGLTNFWGYNTLGFFAPHAAYAASGSTGEQVAEFRAMVAAFHAAGLEVILDVVYNHTAEGGPEGPTVSFRGIDHVGYYRLTDDLRHDYDVTGCGNSVDSSHPMVRQLIVDSLRYWVSEMGVDGFRFDLATTLVRDHCHQVDPHSPFLAALQDDRVLSRAKIIVEPWDIGPHGYRLGGFGPATSEWNDRFRGEVRDFWRGHGAGVSQLAARLCGSPDVFDRDGRPPTASINFVTAHDGFTLRDLVTYDGKHNEANGESNRDGSDDNRSWNCGVEGETDDQAVLALRHRQAANLLSTLLLATGVPMITAGDELGRTQGGNNNAYCQDSAVSWVRWDEPGWADLPALTRRLLRLRASHAAFRRARFRHGRPILDAGGRPTGRKDLAWFSARGSEMTPLEWADGHARTLGMYLADDAPERETDDAFLVWLHAGAEPTAVVLPEPPWAETYSVAVSSALPGELPEDKVPAGSTLWLPGRTVAVLQVD